MCFQTLCLFIRASCVVDVYLEVILWTSLPIMPGLYNKYTHTETWADPYSTHPRNLLPNKWAQNTGTVHFWKLCSLVSQYHLTKTSSTFSVTSEIPEENKTDTIEEDQEKEHEGTSQSFCSACCFSVLIREYGFISVCFCIYTGLSTYGCQLQSLSLRGC